MSRSLVSRRFAGGLMVAAGLVCAAPASAADPDVFGFAASPSPIQVHKLRASPIKAGVLSARVVVLNRGRNSARGARVVLGLSVDRKVDRGDMRLDPQRRVTLGRRPLVQVRMAARVPANLPRAAKHAFACVVVPRSTNPESGPVGVARVSGNTGDGSDADCKMGPQVAVEAAWDWSVPARYGHDKNEDKFPDRVEPDAEPGEDAPKIVPQSWPVTLKASSSCESDERQGRFPRWHVHVEARVEVREGCEVTYKFPREGEYEVALLKVDRDNRVLSPEDPQTVTVEDVLLVSLGDSIASGEGAPQGRWLPVSDGPDKWRTSTRFPWQDSEDSKDCHRSSFAGPALAAQALEDASRKTSVTFVQLACSGAMMRSGDHLPISKQVKEMADLTRGRKIDSVMLTIGANDLSFGDIAIACFTDDDCSAKGSDSHRAADVGLMFLPGRYAQLAQALKEAATGDEALKPEEVLITGYPDPLRDDEGKICGTPRRRGDGRPSTQIKITRSNLITQKEAKWASKTIGSLNTAVREAARLHNWTFVDGITDAFSGHGYCATRDRWIMQYEESKTKQGDVEGTLHPNAEGHRKGYAPFLTAALEWLLDPERQEPR